MHESRFGAFVLNEESTLQVTLKENRKGLKYNWIISGFANILPSPSKSEERNYVQRGCYLIQCLPEAYIERKLTLNHCL